MQNAIALCTLKRFRLYDCDVSVLPVSTAANPVRALAGLALRLSQHLA
ncbi:MAG: hypothetical protein SF187_13055 [Deltaproteobacteria bacterium]|nr:hypothetical protein [Deltaproteobacteria bacterium]